MLATAVAEERVVGRGQESDPHLYEMMVEGFLLVSYSSS